MEIRNMKIACHIIISICVCGILVYASGVGIAEKKQQWKQQCRKEFLDKNRIFGHEGKNHRTYIRISTCISKLSDFCITFLRGTCPVSSKKYQGVINNAIQDNRTRDALIRFGK